MRAPLLVITCLQPPFQVAHSALKSLAAVLHLHLKIVFLSGYSDSSLLSWDFILSEPSLDLPLQVASIGKKTCYPPKFLWEVNKDAYATCFNTYERDVTPDVSPMSFAPRCIYIVYLSAPDVLLSTEPLIQACLHTTSARQRSRKQWMLSESMPRHVNVDWGPSKIWHG